MNSGLTKHHLKKGRYHSKNLRRLRQTHLAYIINNRLPIFGIIQRTFQNIILDVRMTHYLFSSRKNCIKYICIIIAYDASEIEIWKWNSPFKHVLCCCFHHLACSWHRRLLSIFGKKIRKKWKFNEKKLVSRTYSVDKLHTFSTWNLTHKTIAFYQS